MTHNLELNEEQLEIVYFALNDASLKYIHQSKTWGKTLEEMIAEGHKTFRPDYCERKALEIIQLESRVGDMMFESETE